MTYPFTEPVIIVTNFKVKAMVYIPVNLVCHMLKEVEKHIPNETGGVIAGELTGKSEWVITHITMPGPKAIHNRFSYRPDYDHDVDEIARIYQETNCNSVYLGDWHSHPNSRAYMSEKDRNALRTISKSKEARIQNAIMLILGTSPLELGCWTYLKSKLLGKEFISVPVALLKA